MYFDFPLAESGFTNFCKGIYICEVKLYYLFFRVKTRLNQTISPRMDPIFLIHHLILIPPQDTVSILGWVLSIKMLCGLFFSLCKP